MGFSRQDYWSGVPLPSPYRLQYSVNGISGWLSVKECACQSKRCRFDPWVRKIPWRRKWQPTPVVLPGKSHGRRSLVGYNPWGRRESDTTERLYLLYFTFCFIDYARAINCVNHNKLENSQRDGNTRPPDLPPVKSVCRSRSYS